MDFVKESIRSILPTLDESKLGTVLEKLSDCGVEEKEDLQYVQEGDLSSILKPIQIRKLLHMWKMEEKSPNDTGNPQIQNITEEDIQEIQSTSTPPEQFIPSNVSPHWAYTFDIPWKLMPSQLINCLKKGGRPEPRLRRDAVRIIVNEIHKICKRPIKKHMEIIAQTLTQKYLESFTDKINDSIIGSGYESLRWQLTIRSDNVNRTHEIKRKAPATDLQSSEETASHHMI